MFNRFIKAVIHSAQGKLSRFTERSAFLRRIVKGLLTVAHHAVMVSGVAAITILSIVYFKPDFTSDLKTWLPFSTAIADDNTEAAPSHLTDLMDMPAKPLADSSNLDNLTLVSGTERNSSTDSVEQQRLVSDWISKRYHVAGDASYMLVSATYQTAAEIKLDPLLILAVMAIESSFNPYAESPMGAQGLMQVMAKLHHEKFQKLGGIKAALNPVANIKVGSRILKEYVTRSGSVEGGLKMYVGAAALDNDTGYGAKVLAEYQRLKEAALGKKVPVVATSVSKPLPKHTDADNLSDNAKPVQSLGGKSSQVISAS